MGQLREQWTAIFKSLGFRIAFSVGLILSASYAFFVYFVTDLQQDFYFSRCIREAERFSNSVINATKHSMQRDDAEATRNIVRNLSAQPEISGMRIYNHDGIIKFSDQPIEVGARVDKKAEACFACHTEDETFSHIVSDKRARVHHHGGQRVLGMITPIYNEESCYTAPCHVHPEDQKVLGVLDIGMSLVSYDAHVQSLVTRIVLLGIGTFIAVLATISAYISVRVHKPIARLGEAAKKIALGDYSYRVRVDSEDQIGQCSRSFEMMRDQIRRRTKQLDRSRWEYKNLFEQVPCFICVIDKDFEIVRQNSYMRELFRGSIGMPCYQVFKKRSSKCKDCPVDATFREGKASETEHCGLKVSGEEANYLSYTTPILDEKGSVRYAMIIAIDIGKRVELERALEASKDFQTKLIENSIHGIVAADENGRVVIFNYAAESILGYHALDVIGDEALEKYFPRQFVQMILASHMGREIETPRLIAQETAVTASDGQSVPVRFSGVILLDKGKTVGAVGFFQDLRTFKKLEREKQDSDRLAIVGQTVAGLAHGIKNILQGLEGGVFVVETGLEDKDDQLLERGWTMVRNNIGRISGLVKDLLSYSKERTPEFKETDPNLLAEEVCALFDIKAHEHSIVIERAFDSEAGKTLRIWLDQRGIHTCLSNLVANAIDACETDTKDVRHRIIVETKLIPESGMIFKVSDNGVGMSEETKKHVFQSFYSTKGSRGTGLGLLVTSKIIMEHGGEISFESEEGKGTKFTIMVPLGKPPEAFPHSFGPLKEKVDATKSREAEAPSPQDRADSLA